MTGRGDAPSDDGLDDAAAIFVAARQRLFGIAYRILGSAADAEDVVQDAWVRWQTTDRSVVLSPQALLTTITTRLAINVLQSARSRRETYTGPWLPEPVDTSADPTLGAERAEALDVAVLVLLERLTPTERAAYVLREAFDYEYPEIARILDTSPAATRQLVSRARRHLATERRIAVSAVSATARRDLLAAFLAAARAGDVERLEGLLAADVVTRADSDGKVKQVARVAVTGRSKVARLLSAYAETFWEGITVFPLEVNGDAALGMERDGELVGVLVVKASDEGVHELLWQLNPAKLEPLRRSRAGHPTVAGAGEDATPGPPATPRS
ncbi:sigma-70 family RNA polymerase sigma factor [Myceligenerans pegani]|uniref:Sigma-70 family RNA polymerase sigma factor n=1 Tax=Myceligenerans pegani TaxID=2776917 RepID=A0ABR9MXM3_9MICO|nr:sigma-70 family RNA polymerase sigma factor [Myceligenerans sp. TRM 65318]MBE1876140.1 sigma-70 family RNA polymerase sigma factor [Myceligenerans sp. TRM 65318]MBE3018411.1 sigma-70 family RNA polymerase sigma factor [Myceligenerans sp. TRM 65318]